MKGQNTLEFLVGVLLFILVITASLSIISGRIPAFSEDVEQSAKNMEMYRVTEQILSESGRHSYGTGGTNWEKNSSTVSNTEEFGLATDYHVVALDKIKALSTTGKPAFNYTQFRKLTDVRNQYHFEFIWFPIVETSSSFTRTMPPANPPIVSPDSSRYSQAENRVHYGSLLMNGTQYNFLVAAFDGVYNTTYVSESNWDFENAPPHGTGDVIQLDSRDFEIVKFQNRDRKPGASVILKRHLKSFGSNPPEIGSVTKLNRYAVLKTPDTDKGLLRMEVLAW